MQTNLATDLLFGGDHPFDLDGMVEFVLGGSGGADRRDPRVSPLHGDLTRLPPTYLQVSGAEMLLDDARRLADANADAVRLDVFGEQQHTFQMAAGRNPLRRRCHRPDSGVAARPPGRRGAVTEAQFIEEAEQLRRELLGYCYRLCGSVQDAEDLVQETMLRGWRSWGRFRGDATVRTWLYRIATNAFLSVAATKRLHHPDEPVAVALLQTYMRAFETSDIRLLERTLRDDAMLEMTPVRTWFSGRATCLPYRATVIGRPGEWTMRATRANGQPAAVADRHGEPFGVAVLGLRDGGLARISLFTDPSVVARFLGVI